MTTECDVPAGWPEMLTGPGSIRHLPGLIEDGLWHRVLLVCGKRSFEASGASDVLPELERIAVVSRFDDFASNTDAQDVHRGLGIVHEFAPDVILGVGGGSTLDMAKLLCAFGDVEHEDDLFERIRTRNPQPRALGLVLAPTTSGSGSEATHFAVVYIDDVKYSAAHPTLRPDVVVLDPTLSLSASPYQKATSGIDAVSQAIESLWAVGATSMSRRLARRALRYLLPAIEPFVRGRARKASEAMSLGSHLAGRAIDISKTTGPHALSYTITREFGVPHGHAVAVMLGPFIELHASADPSRLRSKVDMHAHRAAMGSVLSQLGATDGRSGRARFTELMQTVGLSPSLADVGVETREQRAEIAKSVNIERLRNNPVVLGREALDALLRKAQVYGGNATSSG